MSKNNSSTMTESIQDYAKAIHELQQDRESVSTNDLADHLSIAPASVTSMIKKMAGQGILDYEKYRGVRLTMEGEALALEMLRHHRLVELYLVEALGVPWDKVHDEAEKWEHVLSEELEDRIDEKLGFPTLDPHGAPIPARDGTMIQRETRPMVEVQAGEETSVLEVSDHDAELLRYVGDLGLYPNTKFRVLEIAPFDGPMTVQLESGETKVCGRRAAEHISVEVAA